MKFSIPRGDNKVKDEIFRPATAEFHATRPFHGSGIPAEVIIMLYCICYISIQIFI